MAVSTLDFSFDVFKNAVEIEIPNNGKESGDQLIRMRMERYSHSVVLLYFVDENLHRTTVPEGIKVTDVTNEDHVVHCIRDTSVFCLGWMDDYYISYQGRIVFTTASQRKWRLKSVYPIKNLLGQDEN